ncbi:GNAT family N-acetyltransferase [Phototrophicus methaneseepsis]|uniref:GNAT family N-acetyltransferase n=1 Tax=Phototrophicus methaneseepsis TaxID=2710758 RepID=A0A7S8E9S1_9CHLR|nr:GNAT family N-acetyltransferase [Phototrophicus methaneseepsis]QPC82952.1 GNAT family N-acetyltransferase [Phototrophicus methaneseepsis]
MELTYRGATLEDVALLARMNKQLIEDENSRNPMSVEQLEARMKRWLQDSYEAVFIMHGDDVVGYMLYRTIDDEYFPYNSNIHIRQYFVMRSWRRRGIGQIAFEQIVSDFFPGESAITLDVLERNPEAKQFWLKLGFAVYHTTLRREGNGEEPPELMPR